MKYFNWNHDKNRQLIEKRHIYFEDVENDNEIFLKTIIPSRKATKLYLGGVL